MSQNCLVAHGYTVKIGDFGLSSIKKIANLTRPFTANPLYMAPELHLHGLCSEKGDIFSFGAILLEMVTGCEPYSILWPGGW